MKKKWASTLLAVVLNSGVANAATIKVDFEGIFDWDLVDGYGGLSGWESMGGQVSSYSEFEAHDPALGENRLHTRAGELTFDQGPVIFQGMFYNYWGSDTDISFSLFYQGQKVYGSPLDAVNQPLDIYWLASGYAGLVDKIQFHGNSSDGFVVDNLTYSTNPVPLPGAVWLFGSGLAGLMFRARRSKVS
ncbi:MAG: PEP-CTERM sorting domain-containing protein [Methylomicrobium sp.]|nr:PEP-CTERM sorting domain-containing protein [Methylomicrobium sp.]